ncbi:DUF6452 family protein [uncultured Eudoraea sp.]|uniref:DUF6452 family protein n=1 Tax=uncultured Eudoraea sp. TaxID=1035614 RepID=UPI002616709D|nr:DUF6452 family protein [uncultured Eudoraea sp.]
MRKIRIFILVLAAVISFNACEKDDICVDGDTPLLIIRFYDNENPGELKAVPNIRVIGLGQNSTVNTIADRTSLDSISLPLRINEPNTGFILISDSADEDDLETGNTDTLTFDYNTLEVFVSRACGFIANYDELGELLTTDSENWIQNIEIVSPLVQKQDSAHVKIFH